MDHPAETGHDEPLQEAQPAETNQNDLDSATLDSLESFAAALESELAAAEQSIAEDPLLARPSSQNLKSDERG
jgi:hypothetical protein